MATRRSASLTPWLGIALAVIVLDHFHVVEPFNEKPSDLRRAPYREATEVQHRAVLKGTRWPLLKDAEELDEEKDEKSRLKEASKLNEPPAVACSMKEDLRRFRERPGERFATTSLDGWIRRAEASGSSSRASSGPTTRPDRRTRWRTSSACATCASRSRTCR